MTTPSSRTSSRRWLYSALTLSLLVCGFTSRIADLSVTDICGIRAPVVRTTPLMEDSASHSPSETGTRATANKKSTLLGGSARNGDDTGGRLTKTVVESRPSTLVYHPSTFITQEASSSVWYAGRHGAFFHVETSMTWYRWCLDSVILISPSLRFASFVVAFTATKQTGVGGRWGDGGACHP